MYRLTKDLVSFLVTNAKDPEFPQLKITELDPYTPRNTHTIGLLDPTCSMGADFDYLVESSVPVFAGAEEPTVSVDGYWLYRKEELKPSTETISIPASPYDPNASEDDMIDVTDCCIITPNYVEKLTAKLVDNLKDLIKLEPRLKECLKPEALKELQ